MATTALIGAGLVAVTAAAAMPDHKTSDASSLTAASGAPRGLALDRANRSERTGSSASVSSDFWLLPMTDYSIVTPWGERPGTLQTGVDLAAPEGTPFYAAHGGTIILARWYGGYGYTVIVDAGNGVELVYGHASKLMVQEGQKVDSGQLLALTGNTGYSFTPHLHFEIRKDGKAVSPVAFLFDHNVSLKDHHDSLS